MFNIVSNICIICNCQFIFYREIILSHAIIMNIPKTNWLSSKMFEMGFILKANYICVVNVKVNKQFVSIMFPKLCKY